MKYDFCILIVLYKQSIYTCETLTSLNNSQGNLQNSKILIWDNSPFCLNSIDINYLKNSYKHITYHHSPENLELSKIYNKAIDISRDSTFLIILDQDSVFDDVYFEMLSNGIIKNPDIKLFVPLIMHNDNIISPGYFNLFKGKRRIKVHLGINSTNKMAIITSGMAVAVPYLIKDFKGFDERFKFYGIDTYFSIKFRNDNDFFYLFDCNFNHDLAMNNHEDFAKKLWRFKSHRSATYLLSQRNLFISIISMPYLFYITIKFYIAILIRKII